MGMERVMGLKTTWEMKEIKMGRIKYTTGK